MNIYPLNCIITHFDVWRQVGQASWASWPVRALRTIAESPSRTRNLFRVTQYNRRWPHSSRIFVIRYERCARRGSSPPWRCSLALGASANTGGLRTGSLDDRTGRQRHLPTGFYHHLPKSAAGNTAQFLPHTFRHNREAGVAYAPMVLGIIPGCRSDSSRNMRS